VSLSEEHGVLEVPEGEATIGTRIVIVLNHAGGTLN
jgi:D-serine deaminase-like pyridoxal phosphate-dependent protein